MAEVQERRKKTVEASMTEQVHLIMQQHLNGGGRLFGGALMQWLDEVAGVVAMRHAETYRVVTAAVDNLQFKHAIYEGEIVVLKGYVTDVGRTSMEVEPVAFSISSPNLRPPSAQVLVSVVEHAKFHVISGQSRSL